MRDATGYWWAGWLLFRLLAPMGLQVRRFANSDELSLTIAWFAEAAYAPNAGRRVLMISGLSG